MTRTRAALVAAAISITLVPTPAFAHSVACQDGPTRLASAERPHVDDPDNDGAAPWVQILGGGGQIIGAWITGPSAWADRTSTENFKATIRLEDLDRHPFPGRLYFTWLDEEGTTQFVRAESDATDLTWIFSYGHLQESTFTRDGATTGVVDTTAATVTITIPSSILPPRPANGNELTLEIVEVQSYVRLPQSPPGGVTSNLQSADIATPSCTTTLYEADPLLP